MAMCLSLAAFNGAAATAAARRCASSTRAASPRPFPTTSRRCSRVARAGAGDDPGDHRRRPDRLGQGHAGERRRRTRWATILLDSGAVYRATALAALQAGVAADDEPALAALAARLDLRFAGRPHLPRRRRRERGAAPRGSRRAGLADLGLAARARRRCSALQTVVSPPARPGGRRARHGHGDLPRRRRSRSSSPRAPPSAPSAAISN